VAIEFNDYQNPYDPNGNHVAILVDGKLENECAPASPDFSCVGNYVYASPPFSFYGQPIDAWVTYNAPSHQLSVYVSPSPARPPVPLITTTIDLASTVAPNAIVGFTGSTGGYNEAADVLDWEPVVP
jgi:hypothetical protein